MISPVWDNITTTSSGVTASISFSSGLISILVNSVLLASPYFLTIVSSLSLITFNCLSSLANKSFKSAISFTSPSLSASNSTFSSFAKLDNLIAKIDFAWISSILYLSINFVLAASLLAEPLINVITLSISSRAINNPSTICRRAFILSKSKLISFAKHSILCFTYISILCFKFNSVGVLLINATWLYDIEVCKLVFRNSFFAILSGSYPFWQEMTILKPFLLLSSRISAIPSISLLSQASPISVNNASIVVPYGIS